MKSYMQSRDYHIPEKLKWDFLYGGDARNARFRKKEIKAAAKKRLLEVKNNKYVLICALMDRTDSMNKFKSYMCKTIFRVLKYNTEDLTDKTPLELAEMLVIAEEVAGRHCQYPNSVEFHCSSSRAIAIRKNQLSFSCDYPNCACEDCEGYGCYECIEQYRNWLAIDLSKELCKDGSSRYGFLKEMLRLYMEPKEEREYLYPEGTFDDDVYNNYDAQQEELRHEIMNSWNIDKIDEIDDYDLGI